MIIFVFYERDVGCGGVSLLVQWLPLHFPIGCVGPIPCQRTKIPHAAWCGQKLFWKERDVVNKWFLCEFFNNIATGSYLKSQLMVRNFIRWFSVIHAFYYTWPYLIPVLLTVG